MKRALPTVVVLSCVVAAVSVLAQSQPRYVIPTYAFTAEPSDPTFQLPDLAERRETLKDLRGFLFGQVTSSVRVDDVGKEAHIAVAVEVVSRNVNADDGRLCEVHLRIAAAGRTLVVDGIGDRWEDAAQVAALKIRRWIAENAREIDSLPRVLGPIR
jgi:hypothetical protein